jgi:nucleoside-diphosphate-sugar epimerase
MGHEAFLELRRRAPQYAVKVLVRPSKVNKKMFAPYEGETNWLEIVWGDLTHAEDVKRAVSGVDYVLHPAAMISPAADHNPEMARKINVGGCKNLLDAIKSEPDGAERIRFVNIGSVAQYGDRLPPIENIKVGDPLKPSVYDYYALTKCDAETMVVESGLQYWASMRQTFICIPNLMSLLDPIMFHQPLEQRIEFITSRDAGYGLVQALEAKDSYWQRIYNMSGGPSCRIRYADFMNTLFGMMGMGNVEEIFERNWFALRNFHCGYYEDSCELDAELGHFRDTKEDFFAQVDRAAAAWMKVGARVAPKFVLKRLARRYAEPLHWIENNDEGHINAFFGSRKAWEEIPGWDGSYRP